MSSKLAGKVALVTGSSAGIGKAITLKFAENGANLIIHGKDPTPELGQAVVREIISLGCKAIFGEADINNYQEVKRMVDRGIERFGKIDILVVSGGAVATFGKANFFKDTDPEDYFELAKIQWLNRAYCVKAVIDHMIERQWGRIVMLGTDAGRWPTPGESMVGASGAALVLASDASSAITGQTLSINGGLCFPG